MAKPRRVTPEMDSAYAKLGRAMTHRDHLLAELERFESGDPHQWAFGEVDAPHPSVARYAVTLSATTPAPDEWALIIGDILSNMRAALDHALVGHAIRYSMTHRQQRLTEDEERNLQFPILTDRDRWFGAAAIPNAPTTPRRNKVDSVQERLRPFVNDKVLSVIEKVQPFNYRNGTAVQDPLAVLNSLVNRDKHRRVRVVTYVNDEFNVTSETWKIVDVQAPQVVMTKGAVIAHVTVQRVIAFPWQPNSVRGGQLASVTGYAPSIKIPADDSYVGIKFGMNVLVRHVEKTLNKMRAAAR